MDWFDAAAIYHRRTWDCPEGLMALPSEWQREIVALRLLSNQINNGGYLQFLVNWGHETYALASRALHKIGAAKTAKVIDTCQALVDEHFTSEGQTQGDRRKLLANEILSLQGNVLKEPGSVLPESVLDRLCQLSHEFINFPDDYGLLAQKHYHYLIENDMKDSGITRSKES
jgi:uncharacterized protein DUF4375